jgi:hypothetical protein
MIGLPSPVMVLWSFMVTSIGRPDQQAISIHVRADQGAWAGHGRRH